MARDVREGESVKDYRTWWRDWENEGAIDRRLHGLIRELVKLLGDWAEMDKEFRFDIIETDCAIEQVWAIREGLA